MSRIVLSAVALALLAVAPVRAMQEVAPKEVPVAPAAMTFDQFCCAVQHLCPGQHEFCVIHPYTCCPVKVCFCLPCGCYCADCKCGCFGSRVVFHYPGLFNNVVVKFKKNGDVATN